MNRRAIKSTIAIAIALASLPVQAAERNVAITFESTAIVVQGVTPKSAVTILGMEREPWGYGHRTSQVSASIQADSRGEARYDLGRPLVQNSVYTVVDEVSGQYGVASPGGKTPVVLDSQSVRVRGNDADEFEGMEFDAHWVQALCVRPGAGAWTLSVFDGSEADDNPNPGTIRLSAKRMKGKAHAAGVLANFNRKDVLVAIDPYTLSIAIATVAQ